MRPSASLSAALRQRVQVIHKDSLPTPDLRERLPLALVDVTDRSCTSRARRCSSRTCYADMLSTIKT